MKTRIAPSPSGAFHLGTARTAYFNWLAAKANRGKFILRIDDTDEERNKPEYTQIIIDSLDWLGLIPDTVVTQSQRQRTGLYVQEAKWLHRCGLATEAENGALLLNLPIEMPTSFKDTIAGTIQITDTNCQQIHQKVVLLRGKDKGNTATYQFASVLDDYLMGITWIIRGTDHISNTPKQIAIWTALNVASRANGIGSNKDLPNFSHIGLIFHVNEQGASKKLSKRDNAASLLWYRDNGYSPDAVLNFILRMGWGINDNIWNDKIITKTQAIDLWGKGTLKSSKANLDMNKLRDLNEYYQTNGDD